MLKVQVRIKILSGLKKIKHLPFLLHKALRNRLNKVRETKCVSNLNLHTSFRHIIFEIGNRLA